jgi:hypothetical protein
MDAVSSLAPPGTSRCSARIRWLTRSRRSLAATLCGSLDTRPFRRLGLSTSAATGRHGVTACASGLVTAGGGAGVVVTQVVTVVVVAEHDDGHDGSRTGGCCGGDEDGEDR